MRRQFAFLYRPARAGFAAGPNEREIAAVGRHFEYLQRLLQDGVLKMAGRCEDTSLGLAVLECGSEAEAQALLDSDPALREGVFLASLKVWRTALLAEKW